MNEESLAEFIENIPTCTCEVLPSGGCECERTFTINGNCLFCLATALLELMRDQRLYPGEYT